MLDQTKSATDSDRIHDEVRAHGLDPRSWPAEVRAELWP